MQNKEIENFKNEVKEQMKNICKIHSIELEEIFDGAFQKAEDEMIENKIFISKANVAKRVFSTLEDMTGREL